VALCATVLAYATGCRSGEIKTLQFQDVHADAEKPFLRIRAENSKGRREREPALNDDGLWAVRQLLHRAKLIGASKPDDYLLPANMSKHTKKTDPLKGERGFNPRQHQNSWKTAWENLKKAAGLQGFRFHDLRHTHITRAIEAGVPIEVVMAQVGHLSAEMTRYYTHLNADAKTGRCEGGSRQKWCGHGCFRIRRLNPQNERRRAEYRSGHRTLTAQITGELIPVTSSL